MTKYFNIITFLGAFIISFVGNNTWAENNTWDEDRIEKITQEIKFSKYDNGLRINLKNIDFDEVIDCTWNGASIYNTLQEQIQNGLISYQISDNSTILDIPLDISLDEYHIEALNNANINNIPSVILNFSNGTVLSSPFVIFEEKTNVRIWWWIARLLGIGAATLKVSKVIFKTAHARRHLEKTSLKGRGDDVEYLIVQDMKRRAKAGTLKERISKNRDDLPTVRLYGNDGKLDILEYRPHHIGNGKWNVGTYHFPKGWRD
jgi:hypothetical protein